MSISKGVSPSRQQGTVTTPLCIVVVGFNTREMALACLRSVFAQEESDKWQVIVVDNASDDGSTDAITEFHPDVHLIRSSENLGFARANNLAAGHAMGEYLLLLNPDTVVLDGAIDRLLTFAKVNPEAGIWGGRTLFGDGSLNPTSCWRRQTLWSVFCYATGLTSIFRGSRLFDSASYGSWKRDSVREVDIVTGCFLLIRRDLWDQLGGFDESFFMYGEEADLCLRAREFGARPMITPKATIIHHGGASEKVRADKVVRLFDAKVRLMQKHWSRLCVPLGVALLKFWCLTRGCMTFITRPTSPRREHLSAWRTVWQRRQEWARLSERTT